ncbi:TPA: hypothetical protein EYG59_05215 [Candidatus Poribacteria bacterium]|nr:hypothetical protein [Candidatus Poribacteria bacterium]
MENHRRNLVSVFAACVSLTIILACSEDTDKESVDWPQWRYSAGRLPSSPSKLPSKLHLKWVRQFDLPQPAWPKGQTKLQFDLSYEPVVMGKQVFVPSMVNDSVTAYQTETGREHWRFFADAPVRFAPIARNGKVYFVSDDGYLYCLDADDGVLLWKFRGGPTDRKVLGNGRLVNENPARGGPVFYDGKIYFASGIYPFVGTYLHALEAETGNVVWTNSGSNSIYVLQAHSAPSFAGISPQGYLVATPKHLFVSGGRTVPACYDRLTGEFLYYNPNNKLGGYEVAALGEVYINSNSIFNSANGTEIIRQKDGSLVTADRLYHVGDDEVSVYEFPGYYQESIDRKGAKTTHYTYKLLSSQPVSSKPGRLYIKAGDDLVTIDKKGNIITIDVRDLNRIESTVKGKIEGTPWSVLAADNKLFVSTIEGKIYCFGESYSTAKRYKPRIKQLEHDQVWSKVAADILAKLEVKDGYCVSLGLGSGYLVQELIHQSQFHLVVIDRNPYDIENFRQRMNIAGVYGHRLTAVVGDPFDYSLPPYLARLVVSEDVFAAGFDFIKHDPNKLYQPIRPYGGIAWLGAGKDKNSLIKWIGNSGLPKAEYQDLENFVVLRRVGALPNSADWTHNYSDPSNSIFSADQIKAPLGLLWFGSQQINLDVLPRHAHGPKPHVVGGRLIIQGVNVLSARDVYTGKTLWKKELNNLNTFGMYYDSSYTRSEGIRQDHIPGANEFGSNIVSLEDRIYLASGPTCHVIDTDTGKTLDQFQLPSADGRNSPNWGYISVTGDLLIATSSPIGIGSVNAPIVNVVAYSPDGKRIITANEKIATIWDANSNRELFVLKGHSKYVTSVAWSSDSKQVATASEDKTARVWDTDSGQELFVLEGHTEAVNSVVWSPDGKRIVTTSEDRTAKVWDAQTSGSYNAKELFNLVGNINGDSAVAYTIDGKWIVTGAETVETYLPRQAVAYNPNSEQLAMAFGDRTIKILDASDGQELFSCVGHSGDIASVAWSPNGKLLASASRDKTAKVWDAQTESASRGQVLFSLAGHTGNLTSVAWSPDGTKIVTASRDKTAKVWDAQTESASRGQVLFSFDVHIDELTSVAWSPDGERIITASLDKTTRCWDADDGRELFNLTGQIKDIADNTLFSSASRTLLVLNRYSGKILWSKQAKHGFRHNAIALGNNKIFCLDKMSKQKTDWLKRRGIVNPAIPILYACDLKTGKTIWSNADGIFGTWLSYSLEHDVVIEATRPSGDSAEDEYEPSYFGKITAYRGSDGKVLWFHDQKEGAYYGPVILYRDMVITQSGGGSNSGYPITKALNIFTGEHVTRTHPLTKETIPWQWLRFKGCNSAIASANLMAFRSGSASFIDLTKGQGTSSLGGFRAGCTSNLIPANGVLSAPDYTRTCTCSYQNQASLAMIHTPEGEAWSFDYYPNVGKATPIMHVGLNLGAPGNRFGENGVLWMEYPSIGGVSPDIPVRTVSQNPKWFHHHQSKVEGEFNWITASGIEGIHEVWIRLFIQPGSIDQPVSLNEQGIPAGSHTQKTTLGLILKEQGFLKNRSQWKIWSEDEILGSFQEPRVYKVSLFFAETTSLDVGERVFDVYLQDKLVLKNFDIVRESGNQNSSVVKTFKNIQIKSDLKIMFSPVKGQPVLCGVEIISDELDKLSM